MIIGDVMKELNEPLFDIVKVLPVTSSKPYLPSLNKLDVSEIFLANPFKLKESASAIVPTITLLDLNQLQYQGLHDYEYHECLSLCQKNY